MKYLSTLIETDSEKDDKNNDDDERIFFLDNSLLGNIDNNLPDLTDMNKEQPTPDHPDESTNINHITEEQKIVMT